MYDKNEIDSPKIKQVIAKVLGDDKLENKQSESQNN